MNEVRKIGIKKNQNQPKNIQIQFNQDGKMTSLSKNGEKEKLIIFFYFLSIKLNSHQLL